MRVAVTSEGTSPDSLVEARFGRGHYFLLFDTESDRWEPMTIFNEAAQLAEGAGTQAAKTVIETGAKAVIASHCGPKAFRALAKGGVRIYPVSGKTAAEAVKAFNSGGLKAFTGPDLCSMLGRPSDGPD